MKDARAAEYLSLVLRGRVPTGALHAVGATPEDLAEWREDEEFAKEEEKVRGHMRETAIDALYAEGLSGDDRSAVEFLRRTREPDTELLELAAQCLPK